MGTALDRSNFLAHGGTSGFGVPFNFRTGLGGVRDRILAATAGYNVQKSRLLTPVAIALLIIIGHAKFLAVGIVGVSVVYRYKQTVFLEYRPRYCAAQACTVAGLAHLLVGPFGRGRSPTRTCPPEDP
jgi:hypothetical protein